RVNQADVPLAFTPTLIDASLPSVPRVVKAVKEVVYVVK
ncbi:MAG: alpha-ketoacid dehydrogenase subunit beta, partial [Flavobacteriales bacterium]|nr:alpha-ketoacid dehydrogenase subunit beta [Flavobacteriales bacterium]